MEPAGIEPATSCLQNASEGGRLRVGSGSRPMKSGFQTTCAGLGWSNPGG
jgi:hypothetical protein